MATGGPTGVHIDIFVELAAPSAGCIHIQHFAAGAAYPRRVERKLTGLASEFSNNREYLVQLTNVKPHLPWELGAEQCRRDHIAGLTDIIIAK